MLADDERDALRDRIRRAVSLVGTQAEAAEASGVSLRQLKKYVSGVALPPPYRFVARLAAAAGLDPEWLMTGSGTPERRPIQGEVDLAAAAIPETEAAGESVRRRVLLERRVASALQVAYAEFGAAPLEADLQAAAQTIATLVLDVSRMRDGELKSAAAEFAVVAHRQAHRLARATSSVGSGNKRSA